VSALSALRDAQISVIGAQRPVCVGQWCLGDRSSRSATPRLGRAPPTEGSNVNDSLTPAENGRART
jgi:hypothetical protein